MCCVHSAPSLPCLGPGMPQFVTPCICVCTCVCLVHLCVQEDRVLFLRFCWGRSRLPAPGRWGSERKFKLSRLTKQVDLCFS
jgi:hypothetical protein